MQCPVIHANSSTVRQALLEVLRVLAVPPRAERAGAERKSVCRRSVHRASVIEQLMHGNCAHEDRGRQLPGAYCAATSFPRRTLAVTDDPDSSHLLADRIRPAVYVVAPQDDGSLPTDQFHRLDEALRWQLSFTRSSPIPRRGSRCRTTHHDPAVEERHWSAPAGPGSTEVIDGEG
jgi:hypothetical protein